ARSRGACRACRGYPSCRLSAPDFRGLAWGAAARNRVVAGMPRTSPPRHFLELPDAGIVDLGQAVGHGPAAALVAQPHPGALLLQDALARGAGESLPQLLIEFRQSEIAPRHRRVGADRTLDRRRAGRAVEARPHRHGAVGHSELALSFGLRPALALELGDARVVDAGEAGRKLVGRTSLAGAAARLPVAL